MASFDVILKSLLVVYKMFHGYAVLHATLVPGLSQIAQKGFESTGNITE